MKVVLDTNVLVSALLTPGGVCGQIVELVIRNVLDVCVDGRILEEYEAVLHRSGFSFAAGNVDRVLAQLELVAERVTARPFRSSIPDPSDLAFLEVAVAGHAVLVTGNKRHYPSGARGGVRVVSPRELLDVLR